MAFSRKDEKREQENTARTNEASDWRKAGNHVLSYTVKVPVTWNGGILEDVSQEIQAIELGGWKLDQVTWSSGTMVLLIFRTEG